MSIRRVGGIDLCIWKSLAQQACQVTRAASDFENVFWLAVCGQKIDEINGHLFLDWA